MARHKEFEPDVALDRAVEVFWDLGYEKASMGGLVDRMGVGRRSLYDTFGDKRALYLKALDRYSGTVESEQRQLAAEQAGARDALRVLFEASIREGPPRPAGCFVVNTATEVAVHDDEVGRWVARSFRQWQTLIEDLIADGQLAGEIAGHHDPEILAAVLFNAWIGLRVQARVDKDPQRLAPMIEGMLRLLD
ncbi:TetR/AcrR family transcriptional regulator [Micromonospora sp. NPDC005979]|uniref:TetR/AcrR family transcriptional regulator n=1 Tax=Micromonospora sp. NPDC005979 TaxID=3156726 RepID=UPI0033B8E453